MKVYYTELDRELKGPATYEIYNAIGKNCKKKYTNTLILQLSVLLIISLLSSIWSETILKSNIVQATNLILIIIFIVLMLVQFKSNRMIVWQKARFMAESTLSESWFFFFSLDIYKGDLENSKKAFTDRIKEMKLELKIPNITDMPQLVGNIDLLPKDLLTNNCPAWIEDNFNRTIKEKTEFYIKHRVDDQIQYYTNRTNLNINWSERFFYASIVLNVVGAIFTILSIMKTLPNYTYLGLFTTLSAAFVSWTQIKRYEEVSTTSSVAEEELNDMKMELPNMLNIMEKRESDLLRKKGNLSFSDTEILKATEDFNISKEDLEKKIFACEKLISREHKVKRG